MKIPPPTSSHCTVANVCFWATTKFRIFLADAESTIEVLSYQSSGYITFLIFLIGRNNGALVSMVLA